MKCKGYFYVVIINALAESTRRVEKAVENILYLNKKHSHRATATSKHTCKPFFHVVFVLDVCK